MATKASVRVTVSPGAEGAIGEALKSLLVTICQDIVTAARRLVPWLSGDLSKSITAEVDVEGDGFAGRVGSNLDYALAVEFGRPDIPAYPVQPYLAPALYQVRGR